MANGQVLQFQRRACADYRTQRRKESGQQNQYQINAIFSKRTEFLIGIIHIFDSNGNAIWVGN